MSEVLRELRRFLRELKRRKVYRVAVVYAAAAFVVIEAADLVFPALQIPPWAFRLVVILALLGFPIALVLAWALEITPEGVRVTPAQDAGGDEDAGPGGHGSPTPRTRRASRLGIEALVVLGLVAAAVVGSWYLVGAGGGTAEVSDRSIAVLPFEPLGRVEPSAFTEGIHDDLLIRLSNVGGFRVIARTSMERYRGTGKTPSEIARELGVRWVLGGGVQEIEDRIKVNVQLIDPRTGANAWAQGYERDLTAENLFAIQSEITQRIAEALQTRLSEGEERAVVGRPTDNLEAYRLYVEGQTYLRQREESQIRRALDLFRGAIREDSSYALAWKSVADALYLLWDYGYEVPDDALSTAFEAARTALELDPDLAEAHSALAMLHHLRQEGPATLEGLERAIELRPNYAVAHNQMAWVCQLLGRPERAFEAAERALELDPLAPEPHVNLALLYLITGDREQALGAARDRGEVSEWPTARFYEAVVLYHLGRYAESISVLEDLSIPWAGAGPRATLALAHAAAGDGGRAWELLGSLVEDDAHPFLVGLVHAALGGDEAAFATFERIDRWTTDARWPILAARYLFPDVLGELREDPRYQDMLREIDRAWGLAAEGGA